MDLLNAVALSTLPGIARPRAAAVFKELREQSPGVTLEEVIAACAPARNPDLVAADARARAADLLNLAERTRIDVIRDADDRYPPLLRTIVDPPPVLWVQGRADVLARPAVAIVGSRAATPYAIEVAARLSGELADRGVVVVSGLARGADGAAHRGCLSAGGVTIAVLGCGPDIVYPREHDALAAQICADGALVSELGPGAPPLQEHFPLRNRLISGISLAVVVVEASERSGSLITARCALEQGRDVMAVPGSVLGGRNRGSHALLKDGAKIVESADDILEELGWPALSEALSDTGRVGGPALRSASGPEMSGVPEVPANRMKTHRLLAGLTTGESYDLDELSAALGLTGAQLLPWLTEWEMQGLLRRLAGGRYTLASRD